MCQSVGGETPGRPDGAGHADGWPPGTAAVAAQAAGAAEPCRYVTIPAGKVEFQCGQQEVAGGGELPATSAMAYSRRVERRRMPAVESGGDEGPRRTARAALRARRGRHA